VRELPAPGWVEIVVVDDVLTGASTWTVTDAEEQAASRRRTRELALRARATRGILRAVLSKYLDCHPIEVSISLATCVICGEPHGKPVVEGSPVQFNLSHTGDTALIAVSSVPVGADIESARDHRNPLRLGQRFYSPAEAEWVGAGGPDEVTPRFLRLWVRKEAVLKATGEGLPGGLETAAVLGSTPLTITRAVAGNSSRWTITDVDDAMHPHGAVAAAGDACNLHVVTLAELGLAGAT
jgi:4'-phosphopantetheinyl transferase